MQDYDAILQQMSDKEWAKEVKTAFQSYRKWRHEGKALSVLNSPLANSTLVTDSLLSDEDDLPDRKTLTWGLEALLFWAAEQIRPHTPEDSLEKTWQKYYSLYEYYLLGETAPVVVGQWNGNYRKIDENYIEPTIAELVSILRQELEQPTNIDRTYGRQWFMIDRRYQHLDSSAQHFLHLTALFRRSVQVTFLQKFVKQAGLHDVSKCIRILLESKLLVEIQSQPEKLLQVHPLAVPYLLQCESPYSNQVQQRWQHVIAQYYLEVNDIAEAAHHLLMAQNKKQAIDVILDNVEWFVSVGKLEELLVMAEHFCQKDLPDIQWARLKIAMGDALSKLKKADEALLEYAKALFIDDVYYKALAYYGRAKVLEAIHADEAIANYTHAIRLLERSPSFEEHPNRTKLLFEAYIDEAWVHIQDKADMETAAQRLSKAQKINPGRGSGQLQSKLISAWGRLFEEIEEDLEQYLKVTRNAYLLALETDNEEMRLVTAINLGMGYIFNGELELGRQYLNEALEIALRIKHRPHELKIRKIEGAYYFFNEEFNEAIRYYEMAYAIAEELDDQVWIGFIRYDLAEALAVVGRTEEAIVHFDKAWEIANKVNNAKLKQILNELASLHIIFAPPEIQLNPRQQLAYEYVKQHGSINLKRYVELLAESDLPKVKSPQASLDLRDMVMKDIFETHGKGRAIIYVLIRKSSSKPEFFFLN